MPVDMGDEYKCAMCGEVFEADRPEREAVAEMESNFPGATYEECSVICDDCYNLLAISKAAP